MYSFKDTQITSLHYHLKPLRCNLGTSLTFEVSTAI